MSTASNSKICAGCKNNLPKKDYLCCSICGSKYDRECVNMTLNQFENMDQQLKSMWKCPECCSKRPKTGNTNTPVRVAASNQTFGKEIVESTDSNVTVRRKPSKSPTPSASSNNDAVSDEHSDGARSNYLTESNLRDILKQELSSTITKLVTAQLNTINDQITGFCESMSFMSAQFEEMKAVMAEKSAIINNLHKENEQLRTSVKDLTTRLNIVESHLRECNVEINGIPEHRSENLVNTMVQLGQVVKNPLAMDDIQHVTRVAKLNKNSDKPRSVIVKLRTTKNRDALLAAVAQFNKKNPNDKLSSHHLGMGGTRAPIYVSEHLTPGSKSLHAAARIKAKEMKYRFTWIRNGKIFVRKDEFSQAILIRSEDSLKLII